MSQPGLCMTLTTTSTWQKEGAKIGPRWTQVFIQGASLAGLASLQGEAPTTVPFSIARTAATSRGSNAALLN